MGVLRGQEHGLNIDPHHAGPPFPGLVHDRGLAGDADVVVKGVDPAERIDRCRDHRRALGLVREVRLVSHSDAALGFDHLDGATGQRQVSVDDEHARSGPGEQDRRRPAVADAVTGRAAAGDDGAFPFQAQTFLQHGRSLLLRQGPSAALLDPRAPWARG